MHQSFQTKETTCKSPWKGNNFSALKPRGYKGCFLVQQVMCGCVNVLYFPLCVCLCLLLCGHHRSSESEQWRPAEASGLPEQSNNHPSLHHHCPQLLHQHLWDAELWILPLAHDAYSLMRWDVCGSKISELKSIFFFCCWKQIKKSDINMCIAATKCLILLRQVTYKHFWNFASLLFTAVSKVKL